MTKTTPKSKFQPAASPTQKNQKESWLVLCLRMQQQLKKQVTQDFEADRFRDMAMITHLEQDLSIEKNHPNNFFGTSTDMDIIFPWIF